MALLETIAASAVTAALGYLYRHTRKRSASAQAASVAWNRNHNYPIHFPLGGEIVYETRCQWCGVEDAGRREITVPPCKGPDVTRRNAP